MGAAVISQRGGDFELTVGQDFSIGYLEHSATAVRMFPSGVIHVSGGDAGGGLALRYRKR